MRVAVDRAALPGAPWQGPDGAETWYDSGDVLRGAGIPGGWVQYQLALGAVNGGCTPRVTEVRLSYDRAT